MIYEIKSDNLTIKYDLQYKSVKNINLRIHSDGSIHISANRWISHNTIEKFIISKSDYILKALKKIEHSRKAPLHEYYTETEFFELTHRLCEKIYPYFKKSGLKYPVIKFREMVSQWGNCYPERGFVTFSTNLRFAPAECIEYVVAHEFVHFLHPNHSVGFYEELAKIIPDWKKRRQKLKEIHIR